ncbi:MAG: hypothetical protein FJW20_07470 [Acidimicrobiia bacterium]|nr:hypothetical protein [Acidimicrobiia bacterium]
MNQDNDELNRLFALYRRLSADPEPSAAFMPRLWEKIEARRNFAWRIQLYARGLVSVAAAVCLAVMVFQFTVQGNGSEAVYSQTYLDTLRSANSPEAMAFSELVFDDQNGREMQ